jgi:hypothetical protein
MRALTVVGCSVVGLGVLAAVAYIVENIRGKAAWENFHAEWTAKGEKFELSAFLPPKVPDMENLAKTPLLAPLFEYDHGRRGIEWRDPAGHQRAVKLGKPFTKAGKLEVPSMGNWETAVVVDLAAWKVFFESHPDFAGGDVESNAASVILTALSHFDEPLNELRKAAERPFAAFPIHYHENFQAALPHLTVFKGLSSILALRALALLAAGKPELALQDIQLGFRLADALKSEPFIISQLVRLGMHRSILQPVWEGMAQRRWSDSQLADLQIMARGLPLLDDYGRSMRGERALCNAMIEAMRSGRLKNWDTANSDGSQARAVTFFPSGWLYQNQTTINRQYQERLLPLIDAEKHRAFPSIAAAADTVEHLGPYSYLAELLLPAGAKTALRFAQGQAILDLVAVATALERFHNSQGRYPEKLAELVPEYIARIPNDVISGDPLKYARTGSGRYVLYSIGWNEKDEQGASGPRRTLSEKQGDWVWSY